MTELATHNVESIKDVVAPQKFDEVEMLLELPHDATPKEREFYQRISSTAPTRWGGGNFPELNISISRNTYESFLDELIENFRLTHSVIFQSKPPEHRGPYATPIEAYLLQGTEKLRTHLI